LAVGALKEIREHLEYNQRQFAEEIGVTQPVVAEYDKGESFPSPKRAVAIFERWRPEIEGLGYTLRDLLRTRSRTEHEKRVAKRRRQA
jgi:transcriptional regulator with XRE-family HTH domain